MLDDQKRVILFWFTIGMTALVIVVALISLLRACGGSASEEPPLIISPEEVSLCLGEQRQFVVEGNAEVTWNATGDAISESGLFTAQGEPGDYTVTAIRSRPRQVARAVVHVIACTPTPSPSPTPPPTNTPLPTATPTPAPTPAPTDPRGDVIPYEGGAPVEGVPASADVRVASVSPDLHVELQPTTGVPTELDGFAGEGDVLLWIAVYGPIPEPPAYGDWLFALDLDGDTSTGRPAGSARINPDMGDDAVIGILYDPASGEYAPYFLVWDPAQGGWADGPEEVRFHIGESRTVVGLALPLETLTRSATQIAGATIVPQAVRGRAAVLSLVGEQTVIDFYPDRPD